MNYILLGVFLGLATLVGYLFVHNKILDNQQKRLEASRAKDQSTLDTLQGQAKELKDEAIAQQADVTEQQKQAFWSKELNDKNNP